MVGADIDPVYAAHHAPEYEPRGDVPSAADQRRAEIAAMIEPEKGFDHVMIDIETMSLHKHKALILSVGMIEFDPTPTVSGLMIGNRSLITPRLDEQLLLGRLVSASTQKFWADQSKAASDHWANATGHMDVVLMLQLIQNFCAGRSRVWANGTQFDLANIEGLADDIRFGDMWHYQAPRDMRTFCRENPATRLLPTTYSDGLIDHHPVDDAVKQAWHVWEHWQS